MIGKLRTNPVAAIEEVIHWTPNTGGGVAGNTDDNALEYVSAATGTEGGLESLSVEQRAKLIRDLGAGVRVRDQEAGSILRLLRTAKEADARLVIQRVGWDNIASMLSDSDLEDFRTFYPRGRHAGRPLREPLDQ